MRTGNELQLFAVSGGFVEVQNNHVTVMAETAEMAHEIDIERARQAAERAKAALRASPSGTIDMAQAQAALLRALARLRTAEDIRRHSRSSGSFALPLKKAVFLLLFLLPDFHEPMTFIFLPKAAFASKSSGAFVTVNPP